MPLGHKYARRPTFWEWQRTWSKKSHGLLNRAAYERAFGLKPSAVSLARRVKKLEATVRALRRKRHRRDARGRLVKTRHR